MLLMLLMLFSFSALAEPVSYRQVSFNPLVASPDLTQVLMIEWGNQTVQVGQVVRLLNRDLGLYGDWKRSEIDGNPTTVDWVLSSHGTYVQYGGSSGGGGAGAPFWVTIVWNSSFDTTCSVGGQSISCDDETEFP